jgi:hypothetical protein
MRMVFLPETAINWKEISIFAMAAGQVLSISMSLKKSRHPEITLL